MRFSEAILGVGVIAALTGCGYPSVKELRGKGPPIKGTADSPIIVVGGSVLVRTHIGAWACNAGLTKCSVIDPNATSMELTIAGQSVAILPINSNWNIKIKPHDVDIASGKGMIDITANGKMSWNPKDPPDDIMGKGKSHMDPSPIEEIVLSTNNNQYQLTIKKPGNCRIYIRND